MPEMISLEEARALVLSKVSALSEETVGLLDAVNRVAARDLTADIDISPFPHSAMDGYALRAADIDGATEAAPVALEVVADEPAGSVFEGTVCAGQCVHIMTGAPLPEGADSVVKFEVVGTRSGDGTTGSIMTFTAPTAVRSNVREAGEEAKAGEVIVTTGEVIDAAGVGFLAGCGNTRIPVFRRPRVAVIATGSELVTPDTVPGPGKIRNSNSYAIGACVQKAGGVPDLLPIVGDDFETLSAAVADATRDHDFVITTGGAANGDFDFIKRVVDENGELFMTLVNMRPGKAQTFGIIDGTPVFGLPGNPAAAYCGFEMIIRPALRKMQGFTHFEHSKVRARLAHDVKKRDPRRIYLRSTLTKDDDGYVVTPAKNQSSGLFGVIQKSNCMAIMPEGLDSRSAGSMVECLLLDIPEELIL